MAGREDHGLSGGKIDASKLSCLDCWPWGLRRAFISELSGACLHTCSRGHRDQRTQCLPTVLPKPTFITSAGSCHSTKPPRVPLVRVWPRADLWAHWTPVLPHSGTGKKQLLQVCLSTRNLGAGIGKHLHQRC